MPDFFNLPVEAQNIVLIDRPRLRCAEKRIIACEECNPNAEMPFAAVLDCVTGNDPTVTDYILETTARCPQCRSPINERTLVEI